MHEKSKHNPSDKHPANHVQAHGSRGLQTGPNRRSLVATHDNRPWGPPASHPAKGSASGLAELEVAPLTFSFHVAVSSPLLKSVLPVPT
jgi:hypothetical protein